MVARRSVVVARGVGVGAMTVSLVPAAVEPVVRLVVVVALGVATAPLSASQRALAGVVAGASITAVHVVFADAYAVAAAGALVRRARR